MRSPRFAVAVSTLSLLLGAGRLQTAEPIPAPVVVAPAPPDICDSRWCGTWHSCPTGHHGPLHAHITKVDDCHYHVRFHGRFRHVIPFVYSITLTVTGQEGDRLILTGSKKVPFYGNFDTCVTITNCDFIATYTTSKGDYGEFRMERK